MIAEYSGYMRNRAVASWLPKTAGLLQRSCSDCPKKQKLLQRRAVSQPEPASVPPIIHEVLRIPGQPLDAATRSYMESIFSHDFSRVRSHSIPQAASLTIGPANDGYEQEAERASDEVIQRSPASSAKGSAPGISHDFSNVRVHTGSKAAESARAVGAHAYTVGQNMVFGIGRYAPENAPGKRLLAHELAHTIQQGNGQVARLQRTIGDGHDLTSPRFAGDLKLEACYDDEARLTKGDQGDSVVAVQQALIDLGYDLGPTGADGIYGDLTWNAVKQFKAGQNLGWGWMGDVGPGTMGRLDELYSGEQGLPPCPEILPFEENTSPNIYVPGKTCQIGGKPPISAKPTADLRFMQEIPPTAGTSVKDKSPEIFCQARFEANVKGSGRGGKIAFLQNIIRSYGIKLGNGHPYNCTLPIGVDHDKYYGIMEPEEESGWIDVPESGSWDRSFKTWDRPSLGSEVDCLPAGAHIDLYRHDKFRMFIFWEPEDDHLVPLAHSDWEWSLLAGFDKMQDGKWITQPWDLHGNYMTPSQEGISPSNQRIITSPVHRTGSCPDTTCGMPEVSADKFASKLVPDRKPEGMKITSSSNLSNKIQNNETPDVLNTTNNKNAIYLQSEDFAVSSFHGGGSACGLACPEPKPRPIIGRGSVGGPIPELQEKLNSWADNSGLEVPYAPLKVDGNFGGKTESAVKFFQSKHLGQTKYVDGVVGQLTWPAIDDEASGLYGLPYGETVESNGWRTGEEATIHRWRHKLDPAETNFYCGWVTEAELGVDDECYKSSFPHLVPERHLTGGTWCVHSSNWWGDDDLGLIVSAVETYRKTSKKLPCTITFWQSMRMQQESEDIEYAVHEMKYIIDKENVTSKKDDVECTRKWP